MKQLESNSSEMDGKVKSIETSHQFLSDKIDGFTDLAARVKAIEEDDSEQIERIQKLCKGQESRVKKEQEDFSHLKRKVNLLESDATKTAKERSGKENEISSRLAELERTVNKENRSAEKLKRKDDTADVKVLSMRLELFERQRAEEVINSRTMLEKIKSLEVATYQLRNEYLQLYNGLRSAKGHVAPEETAQTPGQPPGTPHVDSSSPAVQVPRTPLVEKQARR